MFYGPHSTFMSSLSLLPLSLQMSVAPDAQLTLKPHLARSSDKFFFRHLPLSSAWPSLRSPSSPQTRTLLWDSPSQGDRSRSLAVFNCSLCLPVNWQGLLASSLINPQPTAMAFCITITSSIIPDPVLPPLCLYQNHNSALLLASGLPVLCPPLLAPLLLG